MSDDILFTSYFTMGTPYKLEIERLVRSFDAFQLPNRIQGRASRGNWKLNTFQKIDHLLDVAREYTDRCVVWLDADAEVMKKPVLFAELTARGVDFAAAKARRHAGILGGTMFFGRGAKRIAFLEEIRDRLARRPGDYWGEQTCVSHVCEEWINDSLKQWTFEYLPPEYCGIFWWNVPDPVIRQHQASRRFRRAINSAPR